MTPLPKGRYYKVFNKHGFDFYTGMTPSPFSKAQAEHQRGDAAVSGDEFLEVKPEFMGFHSGEYAGAFPPVVERRIRSLARSPCIHLFSGSSTIGDVRVDLAHPNATVHQDVYQFVQEDERDWAWAVLDPDYEIERKSVKLTGHARTDSVSGNVLGQRLLQDYLRLHADNVLWFDICSPKPDGFERAGFWAWLPGGYKSVRALTWLRRKAERLDGEQTPSAGAGARD